MRQTCRGRGVMPSIPFIYQVTRQNTRSSGPSRSRQRRITCREKNGCRVLIGSMEIPPFAKTMTFRPYPRVTFSRNFSATDQCCASVPVAALQVFFTKAVWAEADRAAWPDNRPDRPEDPAIGTSNASGALGHSVVFRVPRTWGRIAAGVCHAHNCRRRALVQWSGSC
jgi:hypothetical protein